MILNRQRAEVHKLTERARHAHEQAMAVYERSSRAAAEAAGIVLENHLSDQITEFVRRGRKHR